MHVSAIHSRVLLHSLLISSFKDHKKLHIPTRTVKLQLSVLQLSGLSNIRIEKLHLREGKRY